MHRIMIYLLAIVFCTTGIAKTAGAGKEDKTHIPTNSAATIAIASQEWKEYFAPMASIVERVSKHTVGLEDPLLRREFFNQLYSTAFMAYTNLLHASPEHPDFVPSTGWLFNFFEWNPDNVYYMAVVSGDGNYKISGYRGTTRMVKFTTGAGTFFTHGIETWPGPTLADYDIDSLHHKENGYFEVVLSKERPAGYKGDWWYLDPKTTYVYVRQVAYDWANEVDARLAIERLDTPAIKPRLTAQEIDAGLKQIPVFVENWTQFMYGYYDKLIYAQGLNDNQVKVRALTEMGGIAKQKYADGMYNLEADEALIYETEVPQCRYWSLAISDMLWVVVDPLNRQTSLNGHTARIDKDGKFRAVISAQDPGVPNWLDNAGYKKGIMFGRMNECSAFPDPVLTKIKVADVRKYLPADTPEVSTKARDAAIRLRRQAVQLRRRW